VGLWDVARLVLALVAFCTRVQRRCLLASTIEIVPLAEADLPQLFALAKDTFAGLPGWRADACWRL
jgi:hypothetical protein